jgi:hypothetical protein
MSLSKDPEEVDLQNEHGQDELQKLREEASNQVDLTTTILEDREMYYLAVTMHRLCNETRNAYLDVLHQHSLGQLATAEWLAMRASGGWRRVH